MEGQNMAESRETVCTGVLDSGSVSRNLESLSRRAGQQHHAVGRRRIILMLSVLPLQPRRCAGASAAPATISEVAAERTGSGPS